MPRVVDPSAKTPAAPALAAAGADPDDPDAQRMLATLRRRLASVVAPAKIDRFEIRRKIGAGGMGVVFAAWDPDLEREVALKVVKPESGADPARFVREARALAELSHPNVVTVYAAGTHGTDLWIAMELVDGTTLERWLRDEHSPQAIVDMFMSAGLGLAAAHDAGLVHRDFKPSNVLVGSDGRPRVVDFGLVRRLEIDFAPTDPGDDPSQDAEPPPKELDAQSRTGAVLGTPAYMSPEQAAGDRADARADQFSFCVALYEALAGTRPFPTATPLALIDAAQAGVLAGREGFRGGPSTLAVLERGLRARPEDRFSSLRSLMDGLAGTQRPRRWWVAVAAASPVFVAAAWVGTGRVDAGAPKCRNSAAVLAPTWDEGRRAQLERALQETGQAGAPLTAQRAAGVLAEYADAWMSARDEVCREGQGADLDRAMLCLDDRQRALGRLVDAVLHDPQTQAAGAVSAAYRLPSIASCRDDAYLAARVMPPDQSAARAVATQDERMREADRLRVAGRFEEALAVAGEVQAAARGIGYDPLLAEALHLAGTMLSKLRRNDEARELLEEAFVIASEAGDDEEAAGAASELAFNLAFSRPDTEEALQWIRHAEAAADRGHLGADRIAALADTRGSVLRGRGDLEAALAAHERALELFGGPDAPDHPDRAAYLHNIGTVLGDLGRSEEALQWLHRAYDMREPLIGLYHPDTGVTVNNIGGHHLMRGELDQAGKWLELALDIRTKALSPDHPDTARTLSNLGVLYAYQQDTPRAIDAFERAVAIHDAREGDGSPDKAGLMVNLAGVYIQDHRLDEAKPIAEEALRLKQRLHGEGHPATIGALATLGDLAFMSGDPKSAKAHYDAAMVIASKALPPGHPQLAQLEQRMGQLSGEPGGSQAAQAVH